MYKTAFCNVSTGKPNDLDLFEPARVAMAVSKLGLKHVVITSVDRDDLEDGGAQHFANTVNLIRKNLLYFYRNTHPRLLRLIQIFEYSVKF